MTGRIEQSKIDSCFDRLLANLAATDGVFNPIVRLETADSKLIWTGACGRARANSAAPITPSYRFHTASVTKTMTAALILQLAEDGAFGIAGVDVRLAELGIFASEIIERLHRRGGVSRGGAITLRHLLTHTSGLRDAMVDDASQIGGPAPDSLIGRLFAGGDVTRRWEPWDAARPTNADAGVINFFLAQGIGDAPLSAPGTAFHYSDTGFVILALVGEKVGGAPLHRLFRKRLFEPLGIAHTYLAYRDDPPNLGLRREPECDSYAGGIAILSSGVNLSFDWGGGGLVSSAADLTTFLRGLLSGRLYRKPSTLAAMTDWIVPPGLQAPRTGVGLGIFRVAYPGGELVGHSGAWGAKMFRDIESGVMISGTSNQSHNVDSWHWPFIEAARANRIFWSVR